MKYPGRFLTSTAPTVSQSSAQGIWTLEEQVQYRQANTWPLYALPDPQFNYVTMLLHGDGTNGAQNNTFLDSSSNNFTITRNGNTTQGTWSPYGANWSNYFNGSSYLAVGGGMPSGSGTAFTMECWIYVTSFSGGYDAITRGDPGFDWGVTDLGEIKLDQTGVGAICASAANTIKLSTWYHVAVTRSTGNVYKIWVNGSVVATSSTYSNGVAANSTIGYSSFSASHYFKGYISNFRVTASEVYTNTFTPPTTPLTAISGTSLLTCQSNRFIDNSSNNFAITVNGTPSVQRFSPFSPTSAYSTSSIGGSGYFNGSTDWLQIANNAAFDFGASNFTVEAWIYVTGGSGADREIFCMNQGAYPSGYEWALALNSSNKVMFNFLGSSFVNMVGTTTIALNTWYHVAAVRNGSTVTLYVNGVAETTAAAQTIQTTGSAITIGRDLENVGGGRFFTGYISDVRVNKGTAVYTANFTPPSAPLTAVTNTQFLSSMTNAGILDNAEMNDLVTVGSAQVSTSVFKYGTGSMYFAGATANYLVYPSPTYISGTEDFTLECWIYLSNITTNSTKVIVAGTDSNSLGFRVGQSYNNNVQALSIFKSQVSDNDYALFTFAASTWYHVAVTRQGSTIRFFVNGVQGTTQGTSVGAYSFPATATTKIGVGTGTGNVLSEPFAGYIDDLRITKGYARYTANFTPPTAAFPNQ